MVQRPITLPYLFYWLMRFIACHLHLISFAYLILHKEVTLTWFVLV